MNTLQLERALKHNTFTKKIFGKSSQYFNTVQRGSLSLALTFKAQSEPLALVCYGDFENVIRIDAERNAIYDIS